MLESRFSLNWKEHQNNICSGLSTFQQNGEFADMTIGADGHLVQVHRLILALASPYLKELINSAPCQHPVLFLNNVSYTSLCSLLEYIYTGEVQVTISQLQEFLQASRALHIKGLDQMEVPNPTTNERKVYNVKLVDSTKATTSHSQPEPNKSETDYRISDLSDDNRRDEQIMNTDEYQKDDSDDDNMNAIPEQTNIPPMPDNSSNIQYTVSNCGSIQMILNRYMYYLRYTSKNGIRQWQCVNYVRQKCPAFLKAKGDVIIQRMNAHRHPFHDKKILRKVELGAVFSSISDAASQCESKKAQRSKNNSEQNKDVK